MTQKSKSYPSERQGKPFWPLLLILVGVIWLLNELNIIGHQNLAVLFRLWPVILIALGLWLLFGRREGGLSRVFWPVTAAVILVLVFAGPSLGMTQSAAARTSYQSEPLDGATSASISLAPRSANLDVEPLNDVNALLVGTFTDVDTFEYDVSGRAHRVIEARTGGPHTFFNGGWLLNTPELSWTVGLRQGVPLDLAVDSGAGSVHLDLTGIDLRSLALDAGAGRVDAVLPGSADRYEAVIDMGSGDLTLAIDEAAALNLIIRAGAGDIDISLPDDAAVHLEARMGSGEVDLPDSFRRISDNGKRWAGEQGVWETANFAESGRQITILVDGGAGDLELS